MQSTYNNILNKRVLQITFVSGEGSVISLISSTSSKSRASPVVEVVDVSDEEAMKFIGTIMPKDIAQCVVSEMGGRLTHMLLACDVYVKARDKLRKLSKRSYFPHV